MTYRVVYLVDFRELVITPTINMGGCLQIDGLNLRHVNSVVGSEVI